MTTPPKPTSQQHEAVLKSKFLSGLPGEVRDRVFGLTAQLARPLGEWVARYPLMRAVRVPQICLTLAAADPFSDGPSLLPCARLVAWIFAVDDLTDEELVPSEEAWARIDRCLSLLTSPEAVREGEDPLRQGLWEIREELARLPHFSALESDWVRSMRNLLDGMRREQQWSTRFRELPEHPLPTYLEYIENGLWSIGVPPILFGSLMAMREVDVSARAPGLSELERQAATCVRLANDLRSYEREVAEGKLNALILLQRELMQREGLAEGPALERARNSAQERIKEGLERCMTLAQTGGASPGRSELFRLRLAGFSCDFYVHHDYHHALTRGNG